ncbi:hypothetical protein [Halopelagius inordinatus]|uniref:hypothetical protein n=1 Tax=Halopelagius inordinatus TaxID=553467 RepID=UPI0015A7205F|nr:hypothetical protein [Halopelagius inordinatus]
MPNASAVVDAALAWSASTGVPNALFLVAVLTRPAKWTGWVVSFARSRLPSTSDGSR